MSNRSIVIVVVLLLLLIVPLWWLRDGAKKVDAKLAAEQAVNQGSSPVAAATSAEINNPDAFGMTWGLMANDKLPSSAAWMSCHGEPKDGISQPYQGSCNPYKGDASCRLALPVLCIQKDGNSPLAALGVAYTPDPQTTSEAGSETAGWAAGSVASTAPVAGFVLGSLANANARCEKELGSGWTMAEFHEGADALGGWGFVAKRGANLDTRSRHWVHINDQPGNCWNNKAKS